MKISKISRAVCCAIFIVVFLGGLSLWAASDKKTDTTKTTKTTDKTPLRVLFLGNSYTYCYKLPQVVAALAATDKKVRPMKVEMVARGGLTLMDHVRTGSIKTIAKGGWDYVILQDQSLTPTFHPQQTHKSASILDKAIKKVGAKTMLFMTWQRRPVAKKPSDMHERNSKTYMDVGRKLNAAVAPVGYAWKIAYDTYPKLPLYSKDGSHPQRMGAYLTACVFYAVIYDKSPVGRPSKLVLSRSGNKRVILAISPSAARKLQAIAWKAVLQMKKEIAEKTKAETQPTTRKAKGS
ncbi:MAG: SGNH/GDSL hydrolase family protein [bacterium]|nr:SGNH/GDSL hydrolase family protein [bacterium]